MAPSCMDKISCNQYTTKFTKREGRVLFLGCSAVSGSLWSKFVESSSLQASVVRANNSALNSASWISVVEQEAHYCQSATFER